MTGYKVLNEHMVIPGGWHYRVPETGIEIMGGSWPQLHEFVRNHYTANAISIPSNLDTLITEYACRNGADCAYNEVELPKPAGRKSLQIGDVIRFSMSLIHGLTVAAQICAALERHEAIGRHPRVCERLAPIFKLEAKSYVPRVIIAEVEGRHCGRRAVDLRRD